MCMVWDLGKIVCVFCEPWYACFGNLGIVVYACFGNLGVIVCMFWEPGYCSKCMFWEPGCHSMHVCMHVLGTWVL